MGNIRAVEINYSFFRRRADKEELGTVACRLNELVGTDPSQGLLSDDAFIDKFQNLSPEDAARLLIAFEHMMDITESRRVKNPMSRFATSAQAYITDAYGGIPEIDDDASEKLAEAHQYIDEATLKPFAFPIYMPAETHQLIHSMVAIRNGKIFIEPKLKPKHYRAVRLWVAGGNAQPSHKKGRTLLQALPADFHRAFLNQSAADNIIIKIGYLTIPLGALYRAYQKAVELQRADVEGFIAHVYNFGNESTTAQQSFVQKIGSDLANILFGRNNPDFNKIATLPQHQLYNFIRLSFANIDVVDAFDQKTKARFIDLLERIMGLIGLSVNITKLLKEIYAKYRQSTDKRLVPLFKALHHKRSPSYGHKEFIIQEEMKCHLFAHWGLRDMATDSPYREILNNKLEEDSVDAIHWTPVEIDISMPIPSSYRGSADFLFRAYHAYGGAIIPGYESFFTVKVAPGNIRSLSDIKAEVSATDLEVLQTPQLTDESEFATANDYLSRIFGPYYSLDANKLKKILLHCENDQVRLGKNCVSFKSFSEAVNSDLHGFVHFVQQKRGDTTPKNVEELYPFVQRYLIQGGYFQRPEQMHQGSLDIVNLPAADGTRGFEVRQRSVFFLLREMSRGRQFNNILVDKTRVANETPGFYPLNFYTTRNTEEKEKIAKDFFTKWVAQEKITYQDLVKGLNERSKQWLKHFVQQHVVIGDYIICLKDIFDLVGLKHLHGTNKNPDWDANQLELFHLAGVANTPGMEHAIPTEEEKVLERDFHAIDGKHIKKYTPARLNFGELVTVLQHILITELNITEPAQVTDDILNNRDREYVFTESHSIPFLENYALKTTIFEIMKLFKRHIAVAKKGLVGINHVTATQANSLVSNAEIQEAVAHYVYGKQDFSLLDEEDIMDVVDKADMREVLASIGDNTNDIADYLSLFHQELIKRHGLDNLINAFAGLSANHGQDVTNFRQTSPPREEAFTEAVLRQLATMDNVPEEMLHRLELIYRRILRRWVEEDDAGALAWVQTRSETINNEYLRKLFINLKTYFQDYLDLDLPESITSIPRNYQLEAIRYFSQEENRRGIIGDEPGMGKSFMAIAVAETTGVEKVVWATTAGNKQTIRREIKKHTTYTDADIIVIDADTKKEQLRNLDGKKYIVINYEALRKLKENDPKGFAALTDNLGMLVLDEGQLTDNYESQQGEAADAISEFADRLLILSATPIQNRFERIHQQLCKLDPDRFKNTEEDRIVFEDRYVKRGAEGLLELHHLLQNYMLRRRKEETFKTADPNIPLEDQPNALPAKIDVPYQEKGGFFLTEGQARLYAEAVNNIDAFIDKHYAHLPHEELAKKKRNPFRTMNTLYRIISHPEEFGITENPRKAELKRNIRDALEKGEKIVVWAHYQDSIADICTNENSILNELYEENPELFPNGIQYGRFDGSAAAKRKVSFEGDRLEQREVDLIKFQQSTDSEPRIMIAGLEAGGIGLTMTAGSSVFYYEQPKMFTRVIQSYDRTHRADGQFPRYENHYHRNIAQFPPGFLETIEDDELRAVLSRGTLDQLWHDKLDANIRRFRIVADGLGADKDLNAKIKQDLTGDLELKLTKTAQDKREVQFAARRTQRVADNAANLAQAYQAYVANPEQQQTIVEIINLFLKNKINFEDFLGLIDKLGEGVRTLVSLHSVLSVRKKYYVQRFLRSFLPLINRQHSQGKMISDLLDSHFPTLIDRENLPEQVKALLLPLLALESDPETPKATKTIMAALCSEKDSAYQRYWGGRLFVALNHLNEVKQRFPDINVLKPFQNPDWLKTKASRHELINTLYLWSNVAPNVAPRTIRSLLSKNLSMNEWQEHVMELSWESIADMIDVEEISGHFIDTFHHEPHRVLAVMNSLATDKRSNAYAEKNLIKYFQKINQGMTPTKAREILESSSLFTLSKAGRRNQTTEFQSFLTEFEEEHKTHYDQVSIDAEANIALLKRIDKNMAIVLKTYKHALAERYGHEMEHLLSHGLRLDGHEKTAYIELIVGIKLKRDNQELSEAEKDLLAKFQISETTFAENRVYYQNILDLVLRWGDTINNLLNNNYQDARVTRLLTKITSNFGVPDQNEEHIEENAFLTALQNLEDSLMGINQQKKMTLTNIDIIDSNDPYLMMQIGDFHKSVTNCLASDGAPHYLASLPVTLGSRGHRVMVARVEGQIAAMAIVKIRLDVNGRPVYYLEHTIHKGTYDFRDEFLSHLIDKAEQSQHFTPKISLDTRQASGLRGAVEEINGIGGFGPREYDEAVYNVHNAKTMHHKAKTVFDPLKHKKALAKEALENRANISAHDRLKDLHVFQNQQFLLQPAHQRTHAPIRKSGSGTFNPLGHVTSNRYDPLPHLGGSMSVGRFGMMSPLMPTMIKPF
jgi:hypothetical protein